MSELKKCCCDYIPPQYFATKSLPTVLNVHEVCSSSSEFKPFIEGQKYLINSHFHFLQVRRHHALLTKFSRSHVNNKCFFFDMASDNTQCKVTSLKTTRDVAFLKSQLSIYQPMEVLDGFFKVVVPLKNHFHGHKTRKVKTLDFLLYTST